MKRAPASEYMTRPDEPKQRNPSGRPRLEVYLGGIRMPPSTRMVSPFM